MQIMMSVHNVAMFLILKIPGILFIVAWIVYTVTAKIIMYATKRS